MTITNELSHILSIDGQFLDYILFLVELKMLISSWIPPCKPESTTGSFLNILYCYVLIAPWLPVSHCLWLKHSPTILPFLLSPSEFILQVSAQPHMLCEGFLQTRLHSLDGPSVSWALFPWALSTLNDSYLFTGPFTHWSMAPGYTRSYFIFIWSVLMQESSKCHIFSDVS